MMLNLLNTGRRFLGGELVGDGSTGRSKRRLNRYGEGQPTPRKTRRVKAVDTGPEERQAFPESKPEKSRCKSNLDSAKSSSAPQKVNMTRPGWAAQELHTLGPSSAALGVGAAAVHNANPPVLPLWAPNGEPRTVFLSCLNPVVLNRMPPGYSAGCQMQHSSRGPPG